MNYNFISHNIHERNNYNIFISSSNLYFLALHVSFSSMFYGCQLVDIFGYETPNNFSSGPFLENSSANIMAYNFHSLSNQDSIIVFTQSGDSPLYSISELFSAGNWLESENHEMHGVSFVGKNDISNLMLQYGDSSMPLQKSFPTIGLREMFYDPVKDVVVQNPVSVQI